MRGTIITLGLILALAAIVAGVTYASGARDRRIQQLWHDEDALIRAKQIERERNPVKVQPTPIQPAPVKPAPGQRDA